MKALSLPGLQGGVEAAPHEGQPSAEEPGVNILQEELKDYETPFLARFT